MGKLLSEIAIKLVSEPGLERGFEMTKKVRSENEEQVLIYCRLRLSAVRFSILSFVRSLRVGDTIKLWAR